MLILLSVMALLQGTSALAQVEDRLQSLGGNKELIRKAKAMDSKNKFRVVQKRAVDRTMRVELGANYGVHSGGDPYYDTAAYGGFFDLHITPRWSVGARHQEFRNALTAEGQRVFGEAERRGSLSDPFLAPDIDYPLNATLGVVSFYPIYGKLNFFDTSVIQFDLYLLGGAGQVRLNSGAAQTWTAGTGVGVWLKNHFSMRGEVRYQTYEDQVFTGPRDVNLVVSTLSIGLLL